jgi:flagellar basal-body rod protein FlgB
MNHRVGTQALSDPTMALLERVLDFRAERHTLIISNIANAETPRYHAMDTEFEGPLKSVMVASSTPAATLTHPRHLPIQTEDRVAISHARCPGRAPASAMT